MADTVVCIPTFQEAGNIGVLLRRLRDEVPDVDIVIGDDSSPDGTAVIARELGAELGRIEVRTNATRVGLGGAYRRMFAEVMPRYEIVCQMDADLSHDPSALPALIAEVRNGADIALGSRHVPGGAIVNWPLGRRLLSRGANLYARLALGLRVSDSTSGFKAYRSDALRAISIGETRSTGYAFQIESIHRAQRLGHRVVEVPITFVDREEGTSKLSIAVSGEALRLVAWWALRDRVLRRRA